MVKAFVISGLGIGCHEETAHAYEEVGADVEIVHIKQLLSGGLPLDQAQILNFSGGFLHGDILGAGMAAANELEQSGMKDKLLEFAEKGIIYGQCNGYQLLVKTGLLPGIDNDYSEQTVTLTHNSGGNYRVAPVYHRLAQPHFAFEKREELYLWCRHAEGNLQFHSKYGSVSKEVAEQRRQKVNARHVLLRYEDPIVGGPAEEFPHNPNGSVDGIAGLVNGNGHIFGHMAHTEASLWGSRDARYFQRKDDLRRMHIQVGAEGQALRIFENIVNYFK